MEMTRSVPSGSASSVAVSTVADDNYKRIPIGLERGSGSRKLLARMLRVMFPHPQIGDDPYIRTAEAVLNMACEKPGRQVAFAAAIQDLMNLKFEEMDDAAALDHLRGMQGHDFFTQVQGSALLAFYDDPEVWEALGYEGPSFDKGGYVNRGFNDLDWLPEPRIEEYQGGEA
ncbi:hypothetical protein [Falsirhodobacter sp. 20TX0035]|uniref:hypothetical protein n=1 Tax=Falsirhodobacter sp. 20TX0035 TaxID=3022019 RepID=UPI00233121E2|nr:hypothetical protein [Falsirhodobacter sp. 20TX0035]MDB6454782.1 hypothetical protein [Falsirhodobacter sp. 20TX0035]